MLACIYKKTRNYVRVDGMWSEELLLEKDCDKGEHLVLHSLTLSDDILKEIKKTMKKWEIGSVDTMKLYYAITNDLIKKDISKPT